MSPDATSGERRHIAQAVCDGLVDAGDGSYVTSFDTDETASVVIDRVTQRVMGVLVPAGHGWCPVHGSASCPEDYMLRRDGTVLTGYLAHWSEDLRCGQRQATYRVDPNGGRRPS